MVVDLNSKVFHVIQAALQAFEVPGKNCNYRLYRNGTALDNRTGVLSLGVGDVEVLVVTMKGATVNQSHAALPAPQHNVPTAPQLDVPRPQDDVARPMSRENTQPHYDARKFPEPLFGLLDSYPCNSTAAPLCPLPQSAPCDNLIKFGSCHMDCAAEKHMCPPALLTHLPVKTVTHQVTSIEYIECNNIRDCPEKAALMASRFGCLSRCDNVTQTGTCFLQCGTERCEATMHPAASTLPTPLRVYVFVDGIARDVDVDTVEDSEEKTRVLQERYGWIKLPNKEKVPSPIPASVDECPNVELYGTCHRHHCSFFHPEPHPGDVNSIFVRMAEGGTFEPIFVEEIRDCPEAAHLKTNYGFLTECDRVAKHGTCFLECNGRCCPCTYHPVHPEPRIPEQVYVLPLGGRNITPVLCETSLMAENEPLRLLRQNKRYGYLNGGDVFSGLDSYCSNVLEFQACGWGIRCRRGYHPTSNDDLVFKLTAALPRYVFIMKPGAAYSVPELASSFYPTEGLRKLLDDNCVNEMTGEPALCRFMYLNECNFLPNCPKGSRCRALHPILATSQEQCEVSGSSTPQCVTPRRDAQTESCRFFSEHKACPHFECRNYHEPQAAGFTPSVLFVQRTHLGPAEPMNVNLIESMGKDEILARHGCGTLRYCNNVAQFFACGFTSDRCKWYHPPAETLPPPTYLFAKCTDGTIQATLVGDIPESTAKQALLRSRYGKLSLAAVCPNVRKFGTCFSKTLCTAGDHPPSTEITNQVSHIFVCYGGTYKPLPINTISQMIPLRSIILTSRYGFIKFCENIEEYHCCSYTSDRCHCFHPTDAEIVTMRGSTRARYVWAKLRFDEVPKPYLTSRFVRNDGLRHLEAAICGFKNECENNRPHSVDDCMFIHKK